MREKPPRHWYIPVVILVLLIVAGFVALALSGLFSDVTELLEEPPTEQHDHDQEGT